MPGPNRMSEKTLCERCLLPDQAAEEEYMRLVEGGVLGPGVRHGLLHGRMSAPDKGAALEAFASGATDVLIATTVVEVGAPTSCFRF